MTSPIPAHPAIDAVMSTAASLLGMEVVFLGGLTADTFTFEKVKARAEWPGVEEGRTGAREGSLCSRLLAGAPSRTSDAASHPDYADAAHLGPLITEGLVIRRVPDGGWSVGDQSTGDQTTGDLTSAMVLADLLAAELAPGNRPTKHDGPLDEVGQLRMSVKQLEHALAARVVVEQAIGVLTERQHSSPRQAFERLRKVARSRGRKVHDLSREIVLSATDPAVPLPPELAGRR